MKSKFTAGLLHIVLAVASVSAIIVSGCSKPEEPECIPAPAKVVVKPDTDAPVLRIAKSEVKHAKGTDHCQVCVMSPARFISCQRIWADQGESRDEIKVKATEKACKDAGYPDTCPKKAIMSVYCKGDPLPEGALNGGLALQKIHFVEKNRATGKKINIPEQKDSEAAGEKLKAVGVE